MKNKLAIITMFSMLFGIIFPVTQPVFSNNEIITTIKTTVSDELQTAPTPAKFALLVGINDYTDKAISDLNGCENDVKLMREMLSELYGFKQKTDTKELLSSNKNAAEQPTQKAILDNFDKYLIENAKKYFADNKLTSPDKGATVVFYYSGHGSHLPDDGNKDESDGEDETIVPMDSDIKGTKDIRDDEFEKRFAELKKYTSNITFIFDSCHSGTITRGVGRRSVTRDSVAIKTRGGTDTTLNENMDSAGESYVTISGSLPNELSQEDALPSQADIRLKKTNPKMDINGYMTYFLVQTLRETPDATYREVMNTVRAAVQKRNSEQHPQIEGDVERKMFGSSATRGRNGILIKEVKKENKNTILTIEAGKIVGAYPGGSVAIYKQMGDEEVLAVGEIIAADDFAATVKVADKEIPANAKIVLSNPYFGNNKRFLALDLTPRKNSAEKDDAGLQMIKRLSQKLEKSDFVSARSLLNPLAKDNRKDWNIAIVRSTYAEFKNGNRQGATKDINEVPQDTDEVYYLASTNGNPLYNFYVKADNPKADDEIQSAIEKFVRIDNLRTLGNESSDMNKGLEMKIIKLKSADKPSVGSTTCNIVEDGALQSPVLNPSDWFVFEITNKTGEDLFPYIYSIGTNGKVSLLHEPKADGDKLLNNVTMRTWGARKCIVFRATPPYGIETFKLFAASERFNGRLLESSAIARERSKGINPLENLLSQASTNTRDTEVISFEFSGWATASTDIEIKEK